MGRLGPQVKASTQEKQITQAPRDTGRRKWTGKTGQQGRARWPHQRSTQSVTYLATRSASHFWTSARAVSPPPPASPTRPLPSTSPPVWHYQAALLPLFRLSGVAILLPPVCLAFLGVFRLVGVPSPHGPPLSLLDLGIPLLWVFSAGLPRPLLLLGTYVMFLLVGYHTCVAANYTCKVL